MRRSEARVGALLCATFMVVAATGATTSNASTDRDRTLRVARLVPSQMGNTSLSTTTAVTGIGRVSLVQDCAPASIAKLETTTCSVRVHNNGLTAASLDFVTKADPGLKIVGATGAKIDKTKSSATAGPIVLDGATDFVPSIGPGISPAISYLPLDIFGVTPHSIGDDESIDLEVPEFVFGGQTYHRIGVNSNGFIELGGATPGFLPLFGESYVPSHLPYPSASGGVLAPLWADLDGTNAPGILLTTLTDGVSDWIVVEWQVRFWGQDVGPGNFQVWIGTSGVEDVSYTYQRSEAPTVTPFIIGVQNMGGTAGSDVDYPRSLQDYVITTTGGSPGGSTGYAMSVQGKTLGTHDVSTTMSDATRSSTVSTPVTVTRR